MVSKFGLYAYGLVGKSLKYLNILGIDKKSKVYSVEERNMAVLVSKIDTGRFKNQVQEVLAQLTKSQNSIPNNVGKILLAHQEVVDALSKLTPIVPFKFATILKNEAAALKMLKSHKVKFKRLLSKFIGREEWGIKAYADSKKFKAYLVRAEPKWRKQIKKRRSSGTAYLLGKKREEEIKDAETYRFNQITNVILRETRKYAFEVQLNKILPQKLTGAKKEMIFNCAYLLEKEKVTPFHKQTERLVEKYKPAGIELVVSGPWPAYSFVN